MDFQRLIALVTGGVEEEILLRNEYLCAENRILKARLKSRVRFRDDERRSLAEIGARLGREALGEVASLVQPETILRWHRKLVAKKWDGSRSRRGPGRPRMAEDVEAMILKLAAENRTWGYKRISGALKSLGHELPAQTVANVLKRHGISPSPERRKGTSWKGFLSAHKSVMAAADFFTAEVCTPLGLMTYYVLFFIRLSTRRVEIAGITRYAHPQWLEQVARNATMDEVGFLSGCRYFIRDRDPRYTESGLDGVLKGAGIEVLKLPARSPNLNAYAERFVRSVREECLSRMILVGEASLRRALEQYLVHYNHERPHQGVANEILSPVPADRVGARDGPIKKRERLGGMLNFYYREAG